MDRDQVHNAIAEALEGRRLLEHPFYRRWEAGALADGELAAYAEQYRHAERALPEVMATIVRGLPAGPGADLVAANLADELSVPEPHVDLFEGFADAVSAHSDATAGPAVTALVDQQRTAAAADAVAGLAMLAAYEVQSADIAATKSAGLTDHYGVDPSSTRFWDVHAHLEADHADWTLEALALLATDPDQVRTAARAGAEAWWQFLDEREAAAPVPA
jgi:pyrroloquinoline quinone (PQQ) biosynthesis protein C